MAVPSKFDLAGELAEAMRSAEGAFRFVRRFSAVWTTPLTAEDRVRPEEIDRAERRLGITFPLVLRQAMLLFGSRYAWSVLVERKLQNALLRPDEVSANAEVRALMFQVENQGVWERYIRLEDLHLDDPPTFQTSLFDYTRLLPLTDRLSVALVDVVLRERWWLDERLIIRGKLPPEEITAVEGRFEELALSSAVACHDLALPVLPDRWFLAPDVLVHLEHVPDVSTQLQYIESLAERFGRDNPWLQNHVERIQYKATITLQGRTPQALGDPAGTLPQRWFD